MNVEKQIAKLESLLGRIKRNVDKGRPHEVTVPAVHVAPVADEAPHSALPPTARADVGRSPIAAAVVAASPAPPIAARAPMSSAPELSVERGSAELEDLDMMDSEIVELGAEGAGVALAAESGEASLEIESPLVEEELGAEELEAELSAPAEEVAPKSAPRAATPARADDAEYDLEPLKTPPPESGRQIVAPAPLVSYADEAEEADLAGGSDVDDLLQADLSGSPISKAPPGMPTMEQLGETVELEGADGPAAPLELEAVPVATREEAPLDDMELDLPRQEFSGAYDAALASPTHATADLERHQQTQDQISAARSATPPSLAASPASLAGSPAQSAAAAPPVAAPAPVVVARPPLDVMHPAEVIAASPAKTPETFLDLLDQSLSLKI